MRFELQKDAHSLFIDVSQLSVVNNIMGSGQFTLWKHEKMEGAFRKIVFSRQSLLGEISKYYFEDYILWKYQYPHDPEFVRKRWRGHTDTFLTRFIFLHPDISSQYQRKAIWFGFYGYIDVIIYSLLTPVNKNIQEATQDIATLLIMK